ncbi:MAG TPA: hypothetical protein VN541_19080 [Tepidisphaeraceae bacterium]|nr:hypothetical protein [Tepidisphaeraceae bacterium]
MTPHHPHHSEIQKARRPEAAGELAQLALWMAARLAGMITVVLIARGPFFQSLAARLGRGKTARRKPSLRQSLPMLAAAVVGSSKSTIESVFGPPRSAGVKDVGVVVHPQMVFWNADVWYYPLPREGPMAMAINFVDDRAAKVEFFTSPHPPV